MPGSIRFQDRQQTADAVVQTPGVVAGRAVLVGQMDGELRGAGGDQFAGDAEALGEGGDGAGHRTPSRYRHLRASDGSGMSGTVLRDGISAGDMAGMGWINGPDPDRTDAGCLGVRRARALSLRGTEAPDASWP